MKSRTKVIIIVISIIVSVGIVVGALYATKTKEEVLPPTNQPEQIEVTTTELKQADGKNNNKCWLAVDGKVYEISQSALWKDGQHTPSNEQAYCGADMTEAMNAAPHGRKKLDQLTVIGTIKQ